MSGQLVGEVLDARESGLLADLSATELLALVAIAEKCLQTTREGSVRMARVAAVMGRSPRTAGRAVAKLGDLKLVERVKAGYKSHDGATQAAVYKLLPMPVHAPSRVADANGDASATQDGGCTDDLHRPNTNMHRPFEPLASAKSAHASAIQGGDHDGCMTVLDDGLDDGGSARAEIVPATTASGDDPEPPLFCRNHPQGTNDSCGPCSGARKAHEAWLRRHPEVMYHTELDKLLAKKAARADVDGEYFRRRHNVDASQLFAHRGNPRKQASAPEPSAAETKSEGVDVEVVEEQYTGPFCDQPDTTCQKPAQPGCDDKCGYHYAMGQQYGRRSS